MACLSNFPVLPKPTPQHSSSYSALSPCNKPAITFLSSPHISRVSPHQDGTLKRGNRSAHIDLQWKPSRASRISPITAAVKPDPLKIMISGAPASGKGTQCEFIKKKYGLVHIAAGDLLRVEIAAGSANGKRAKEYMEKGQLVPDEIVVTMVKERLFQQDAQENGWLLDGYPRSLSQATALENLLIRPDIFLFLDVPEEILVERVVGRRLDPVTGKIYHLKYSPPETKEIADRLTRRFDDTEEKVKLRLQTYHQSFGAVLQLYKEVTVKINGKTLKEDVFAEIDAVLSQLLEQKRKAASASMAAGTIL
ncbi:adenylate kinase, chloroplastic [Magnolia sinica]|uniref:adenylate kinase, chloroplastic n=1 Tax=Magnolia sinica TaxID=86752 RepID=UPI00265A105F|nr:adenylate kinase, chloroplastic [Magnolia sinica]